MSIKKKEKIKQGLYSAGALLLCAVLLLSLWITNRNNNRLVPETTSSTETPQPTEEIKVNIPITNVPDNREEDATNPQDIKVYFEFPLKNKIVKAYSNGEIVKNTTTDDWRTHNALDIEGKSGESVVSICDGVVIEVTHDALWGTTIIIDHGNGYTAKYCGLKKDSVPELNQKVKSNEKIGVLDEIPMESADGIHLHFEMYKDGKNVSPIKYLGKEITV